MFEPLKYFFRRNALKKGASDVPTSLLKLSEVHTAVAFIDVEDTSWEEAKNGLMNFFRKNSIRGEIFFFDMRKLSEGERLITSITNTILKKDMGWYGKPSKEKLALMLPEEAPDLFISLIGRDDFAVEYLAKCSRARFKIGRSQFSGNVFDLVVTASEGKMVSETMALKKMLALLDTIC